MAGPASKVSSNTQRQAQLQLSDRELQRLKDRIYTDFVAARSNHDRRIERFRRLYCMWRGLSAQGTPEDGKAFEVPMLKWFTLGHWARCMSALLGDDAEIVAVATAPTDEKDAVKVGHYMTWRWFDYMKVTNPLTVWVFRAILFGRAIAEQVYEQEYYWQRDPATGEDREVLCYDGPRLAPLWPSQIILPAQDDVMSIDDFEWTIPAAGDPATIAGRRAARKISGRARALGHHHGVRRAAPGARLLVGRRAHRRRRRRGRGARQCAGQPRIAGPVRVVRQVAPSERQAGRARE